MNDKYYEEFNKLLDSENKEKSLLYIMDLLETKKKHVEDIYESILIPSMKNYYCEIDDKDVCVWKEHIRSSIVRSIIECTYPSLINRRNELNQNKTNQKVLIVSPSDELHEIGGLIINNYFILSGFDTHYIGVNTPKNDILSAIKIINPDYVAISVTNYYNLFITKQIIDEIKEQFDVKVIIGGQAFNQKGAKEHINYDYHFNTLDEIIDFSKAVIK